MLEFKVTAFVPTQVVRGGGNFGMLLVVENTSANSIAEVVTTAGELGWGEGEEIGSIPAGEGRRATLNLKLKDRGDWVIPVWVGRDEDGVEGWKGVLTTGADSDKDYGVKNVTIVGQQISGERAGWGSVNEIEMNLKELADVLDPATREQIHKGLLVPVPVQLERRDSHLWQKHLNEMKRTEESPKPAPVPEVHIHNHPPVDKGASRDEDGIAASAHGTIERIATGWTMIGGVIVLLVVLGLFGLVYMLVMKGNSSEPEMKPVREKITQLKVPLEDIPEQPKEVLSLPIEGFPDFTCDYFEAELVELSEKMTSLKQAASVERKANGILELRQGSAYTVRVNLLGEGYLRVLRTGKGGRIHRAYPNFLQAGVRLLPGVHYLPDPRVVNSEGQSLLMKGEDVTPNYLQEIMLIQYSEEPFDESEFEEEGETGCFASTRSVGMAFFKLALKKEIEMKYQVTL